MDACERPECAGEIESGYCNLCGHIAASSREGGVAGEMSRDLGPRRRAYARSLERGSLGV